MKLTLDVFEGPLDLLLYLIKKNNLEIARISIARIARQYLEYIDTMKELDIDLASDFLVMAAELAQIKSRYLLPEDKPEAQDDEDPSADSLVAKLRLYQKYKELAAGLNRRTILGRDVFARASIAYSDLPVVAETRVDGDNAGDGALETGIYDLACAFAEMLKRRPRSEMNHRVVMERVSVTERIYEILAALRRNSPLAFAELFPLSAEKIEWVVTFLAVLEMCKLKMIGLCQAEPFGPIRLELRMTLAEADGSGGETPALSADAVTYR